MWLFFSKWDFRLNSLLKHWKWFFWDSLDPKDCFYPFLGDKLKFWLFQIFPRQNRPYNCNVSCAGELKVFKIFQTRRRYCQNRLRENKNKFKIRTNKIKLIITDDIENKNTVHAVLCNLSIKKCSNKLSFIGIVTKQDEDGYHLGFLNFALKLSIHISTP